MQTEDLEKLTDDQIREMLKPHLSLFMPGVASSTLTTSVVKSKSRPKPVINMDTQGMLRMLEQAKAMAKEQLEKEKGTPPV